MKNILPKRIIEALIRIQLYLIIIFGFILAFSVQNVNAYDNDTHFWLTYYLAIKSGYSPTQATQIASATISVDFDSHTTPVFPRSNFRYDILKPNVVMQNVRIYLHALPLRETFQNQFPEQKYTTSDPKIETDPVALEFLDKLVLEKQNYRWGRVLEFKDNPGVFLHYLQDKYAHRGFTSVMGHSGYEYVDFLASDPKKAELMVRETVNYLIEFRKIKNGRKAVSTTEGISNNWKELDDKTWSEIIYTLNKFIEVNPSPGIQETQLLKKWYSTNKLNVLRELYRRWKYSKVPDSFKSRTVVKEQLKLQDDELPWIWFYDLQQGGFPIENTEYYKTSKILAYKEINSRENLEKKNARNKKNQLLCLPWKVVDSKTTEISSCLD
ncbi:MAG TPA: DUF6765 family protein [Pyrinomonadaceae bacterium]|jgi:hypothetical protein